jgi:prepilin-type N-terminal cleavage/methylation domain-containing protein
MITRRGHQRSSGYTLVEMLTTIAVLVIMLGLMVSLARRVRSQSAKALTGRVLLKLDVLMAQYLERHHRLPTVAAFVPEMKPAEMKDDKQSQPPPQRLDEALLQQTALRNNRELIQVLRGQADLARNVFSDLPISVYDDATLRDAWGTPIVFMPRFHPAIGMAPGDQYFFVSAGPDGHFLTRDDNLYSYEGMGERE